MDLSTVLRLLCLIACELTATSTLAWAQRIEVKATDFTAAKYLGKEQLDDIRKVGILRNVGEAEYAFEVPQTGWYELWVEATGWKTDLYLDWGFLIHTAFASGVWEARDKAEKVLNLHLAQGRHTLKLPRRPRPR